jgi:TetR/AcrR family transcriptional repressor of nem operon
MNLKEKIVAESLRLFSLKGFLNTSVEDILTRAGTSKGGFYNHFKSKNELFYAVLQEAQRIWRERVLDGLDDVQQPREKIKRLLTNYETRYLQDSEDIPGGCIFLTFSVELDDQRPEFASEINKGFVGLQRLLKRLVDEIKGTGSVAGDFSSDEAARFLFNGMLGSSVLYGINKSGQDLHSNIQALVHYVDQL